MARGRQIWWAYLVDILAAALIVLLPCVAFGWEATGRYAVKLTLSAAPGLFLTASVGLFVGAHRLLDGAFASWMKAQHADDVFVHGLWYSIVVQGFGFVALLVLPHVGHPSAGIASLFMTALCLVVFLGCVTSVKTLWYLKREFEQLG